MPIDSTPSGSLTESFRHYMEQLSGLSADENTKSGSRPWGVPRSDMFRSSSSDAAQEDDDSEVEWAPPMSAEHPWLRGENTEGLQFDSESDIEVQLASAVPMVHMTSHNPQSDGNSCNDRNQARKKHDPFRPSSSRVQEGHPGSMFQFGRFHNRPCVPTNAQSSKNSGGDPTSKPEQFSCLKRTASQVTLSDEELNNSTSDCPEHGGGSGHMSSHGAPRLCHFEGCMRPTAASGHMADCEPSTSSGAQGVSNAVHISYTSVSSSASSDSDSDVDVMVARGNLPSPGSSDQEDLMEATPAVGSSSSAESRGKALVRPKAVKPPCAEAPASARPRAMPPRLPPRLPRTGFMPPNPCAMNYSPNPGQDRRVQTSAAGSSHLHSLSQLPSHVFARPHPLHQVLFHNRPSEPDHHYGFATHGSGSGNGGFNKKKCSSTTQQRDSTYNNNNGNNSGNRHDNGGHSSQDNRFGRGHHGSRGHDNRGSPPGHRSSMGSRSGACGNSGSQHPFDSTDLSGFRRVPREAARCSHSPVTPDVHLSSASDDSDVEVVRVEPSRYVDQLVSLVKFNFSS